MMDDHATEQYALPVHFFSKWGVSIDVGENIGSVAVCQQNTNDVTCRYSPF